jgi:tRNA nucleotidyltransferase (CCA-adding enzyme)
MYAEHPYTKGRFMGFDVEIVPCYRLSAPGERMSAVDRTPFHTRYVLDRIDDERRRSVRLLKAFAKGTGVYGAEARVQGFSGYLCELLVLRYGGFRETLQAATGWRPGVVVELEVKPSRTFPEPLVVIDPVDPGRNVSSAVSLHQFAVFIHASGQYLKAPREEFFFPRRPKPLPKARLEALMRRRGTDVLALLIPAPNITEDVLFPQLRKCRLAITEALHRLSFRVLDAEAYLQDGKFILLFEFEVFRLPSLRRHRGPPPWLRNGEEFLSKWVASADRLGGPLMDEDRLAVDVVRTYRDAGEALKGQLPHLSLGKHIDDAVRAGFTLLRNREAITPETRGPLTEFLDRRFPWER